MIKYFNIAIFFALSFCLAACSSKGGINKDEVVKNYEAYQTWKYSKTHNGQSIQASNYSSSIHNVSERYISMSMDVIYSPNDRYEATKRMIGCAFVDVRTTGEIQTPSVDSSLEEITMTIDGNGYTVPIYDPNGNTFSIMADNAKFVIEKLNTSKTCAITVRTASGQNLRFEFNTEGLNWQY